MFGYLVLFFTIVPAIELVVLIKVGGYIGAINTLFVIIFTGVVGAYLARLEGFLVLQKINDSIERGIMPTEEMMDGVMILIGGLLLLTPGFITDAVGFLLLFPITRAVIKRLVRLRMKQMIQSGQINSFQSSEFDSTTPRQNPEREDAEDAEYF